MKKCSRCDKLLPKSKFSKHAGRKDGCQVWCKECKKKYFLVKREEYIDAHYRRKFGISKDQKLELMKVQRNKCLICDRIITISTGNVDHNHQTGALRGILCHRCNRGIGYFNDDPTRLIIAANYLLNYEKRELV